MRALFVGGPLDGRDDYDTHERDTRITVMQLTPDAVLKHSYVLENGMPPYASIFRYAGVESTQLADQIVAKFHD
jgi:hypothetical protein